MTRVWDIPVTVPIDFSSLSRAAPNTLKHMNIFESHMTLPQCCLQVWMTSELTWVTQDPRTGHAVQGRVGGSRRRGSDSHPPSVCCPSTTTPSPRYPLPDRLLKNYDSWPSAISPSCSQSFTMMLTLIKALRLHAIESWKNKHIVTLLIDNQSADGHSSVYLV